VTVSASTKTFDRRLIVPLVLGAILNPVNSSMLAVALVPIAVSFHAVPAQTAWLVAGLYLATATGQPVVGRLVDRYGARKLYLAGTALVGIAGVSRFDHLITGFLRELGVTGKLEGEMRRRVERELFPGEPDIWNRFAVPHAPEQIAVERILLAHDETDPRAQLLQAHETAEAYGSRVELFLTKGYGHHRIITASEVVARVSDFLDEVRDASASAA